MIVPNKFVSFKESALSKVVLTYGLVDGLSSLSDLFDGNREKYDSVEQFVYAVELLYLCDKVWLDESAGVLHKC